MTNLLSLKCVGKYGLLAGTLFLRQRIKADTLTRWFGCTACMKNKLKGPNASDVDLSKFPVENIRNFSIIAHVDHGKSTLADRLLEITGVISSSSKNEQVLDRLQVERERGITVKAQTASLFYEYNNKVYLLNLIDTPGHVDFNYEVSRSLAACQGVVLLVDANQGVQAQTVANFFLAFDANLAIIPVLNKIDLPNAQPDVVAQQMTNLFDIESQDILKVSAKQGVGVESVLKAVIERVPPPRSDPDKPLKALIFDSSYDKYRGAVTNLAVVDGKIQRGDRIQMAYTKKMFEVQDLGIMHPDEVSTGVLFAGQVGYCTAHIKNVKEAQVGDTVFHRDIPVEPLAGFKPAKAMVFAGIFPFDQSEYPALRAAMDRLLLNDSSVSVHIDVSPALGQGWRLGFLGLLHMDVFTQRLDQEFNTSVIVTQPNVPYKIKITGAKNIKQYGGEEVTILNPCKLPSPVIITEYHEPMVYGTIIAPDDYINEVASLCMERRGTYPEQVYIDEKRIMFKSILPLSEILVDFFDELKSLTSGYASFDYDDHGYQLSDLVKVDFSINGKIVEELTMMCHVSRARMYGKKVCAKLKENIPRQLYRVQIQAAVGSKYIAREDIAAARKDVTAKCYGGDVSRKLKLLKIQAEGKKKMRMVGNIEVPKTAFINVLKK